MKKTIAGMLLALCTTSFAAKHDHPRLASEAGRIVRSRNVEACVSSYGRPLKRYGLSFVVTRSGTVRDVSLSGASGYEEECAQRAMEGAQFPASLAGAKVVYPITVVSSDRDRPQKR